MRGVVRNRSMMRLLPLGHKTEGAVVEQLIWSDHAYSLGIEKIDAQHQRLFKLINDLSNLYRSGESDRCIAEALVEMVKYTESHFTTEEDHMQKAKYPRLEEHKRFHAEFRKRIKSYLLLLKREESLSYRAIHAFLLEWVDSHIKESDRQFGRYLVSMRKSAAAK